MPTFTIHYHNIYTLTSDLPHAKINLAHQEPTSFSHFSRMRRYICLYFKLAFPDQWLHKSLEASLSSGGLRTHSLSHAFPIPPSFFCQLSLLIQSRFQPSITALTYQVVPLPRPSTTLSNPLYQNILNGQLFMIYFTTLFSDFLFSVNVLHGPLSLKINAPLLMLKQICGVNSAL